MTAASGSSGSDPAALETILFACLDAAPADQEAALAAACVRHPGLAEPLRRCWQRIRSLQPAAAGAPTQIAGHRILRRLGGGGMGVVYLAEQERLHRKVALKLIRSDLLESTAARERFQREAIAASKVDHPGLCPVFEVGEAEGVPFLVMPYLEGVTLGARIGELAAARGAATSAMGSASRDLVSVVAAVARAAHHAHEHGLVHRDIKPGNIMLLADGRPMLLDFGLARDTTGDDATLTRTGERVGTPAYMAPEQLRGDGAAVDRRTDVYALGIVLYEVALLERPFDGGDVLMLREQIASGIRPAKLRARVPFDLASIILKAADADPARRYATAAELADDLERFLRLEPVTARRLGVAARVARWARRHPLVSSLLVALVVALGFAMVALDSSRREQRSNRAQALLGESRFAERTDVGVAVAKALAADDLDPTPASLVQLNRAVAGRRELHRWSLDAWLWWVAFSPDRQHVHAVAQDGSMHVFDVATRGKTTVAPPVQDLKVTFTAAARDGSFVVFGGTGKQAFLWRPATGQCQALAGAHDARVQSASISDDGRFVFTGDQRGNVARWSAEGVLDAEFPWLAVFPQPPANPVPLEVQCCGEMLAVGSVDRLVLAPIAGGEAIRVKVPNFEDPGKSQWVLLLSSAAEARRLYSAQLGRHGVYDLEGTAAHLHGATTRYFGGHLSRHGERLAIGYRGFVRVYDLSKARPGIVDVDKAPYREGLVGDGPVALVRFSDDGSRLFAAAEDNVLRMFDPEGESLLSLPDFWKPVRGVDYDATTQTLVTGDEAGLVRLWDVRVCRPMPPEFQIPAGRYNGFATGCTDPLLLRRDSGRVVAFPVDGSEPWILETGDNILQDARVHPEGRLVAVASRNGTASAWDLTTKTCVLQTKKNDVQPPVAVDFLPAGRLLVVMAFNKARGGVNSEVQVWRNGQAGGELEVRLPCPEDWGRLNHGAATPDGRHVVIGSYDKKAWVLPLDLDATPPAFGKERLVDVGQPVVQTDVARQGDRFVLTCADNSARVYDLGGGPPLHLVGHHKRVERAHFSPSGKWVVTASQDGTARVWDSRTGEVAFEVVVGAPSPVWDALFREDEKVLYTVSLDGVVRGWLLDRDAVRKRSMAQVPR